MNTDHSTVGAVYKKFHGPWEEKSKIAIGIDIGTTQSGVAFSYLVEGIDKSIQRVLSWPGQESKNQQAKIPTLVWYDANGKAVSFGAEARLDQTEDNAEQNKWQLAEHFKLHLHPSDLKAKHKLTLDPLPRGVPLSQIYADFLGYLLRHTQKVFEERILDGKNIWTSYSPDMDVIIAHPNGWGTREQAFLRTAAVQAGFTTTDKALDKIHFVTEAEASVHFCTYYTTLGSQMKVGENFAVCDAGGSTVDTTVYTVKQTQPLIQLEEKCASACVQAGAIFVNKSAKGFLEQTFREAAIPPLDAEEYIRCGLKDFEETLKRAFRDGSLDQQIEIARSRFYNSDIRTRRGRMTLKGAEIESFFAGCVREIVSSVNSQLISAAVPVSYIILVGGFGESPYLNERLKARFSSSECQIITTTNESASKAVADGALIWHCVNGVVRRAPRYSFGIGVLVPLVHNSKEHRGRPVVNLPSGSHVSGGWSQIVTKNIAIDCDTVSRRPYRREFRTPNPELPALNQDIYAYAFGGCPKWIKNKADAVNPGFRKVCSVTADITNLRNVLKPENGPNGNKHWVLMFNVCIFFGRTELQAYLEWDEHGVTCTGPALIVPSSELI